MIKLFNAAVRKLDPTWHDRYVDICTKVRAVNDWNNPDEASEDLLHRLIYEGSNGVANAGQAFVAWPGPRPNVNNYRGMLVQLKEGLGKRFPGDEVAKCREMYRRVTRNRAPSIFNRIVAAFQPGIVSPVMFEDAFDDACAKLVQGGYITPVTARIGEDPWYSKSVQLMNQLRQALPDGHHDGTVMDIDDYSRGMFVWGVHANINMDDWLVLRNPR